MDNGSVNVNGFPNDLKLALAWINAANNAIVFHFMKLAKDDKLDKDNRVIKSRIIVPDGGVLQ